MLWTGATTIKLLIAAFLPLFVDEAFYWQEGRHLAAAYSDLPGLTAWLTRLGTCIGGEHVLALRMPFLLMGCLLPWLIVRIATRWFGVVAGWQAGSLTVLMPLSGMLGVMALPDVPMALATVLCLDAGARLLRAIDAVSAVQLAVGLVIGALSHYRFAGVIGVGFFALLCLPQGRRLLRDARIWIALAVGVLAWVPLLFWNLQNGDAGLRFQMVDRHPWAFHLDGIVFVLIQAMLVTPVLFVALLQATVAAFQPQRAIKPERRYFGLLGGVSTVGIFLLGFFTDTDRVSFHWPLPGYLALLVIAPVVLKTWHPCWRRMAWGLAGIGLVAVCAYYLALSVPALRERAAGEKFYPRNFAGWGELAKTVDDELQAAPPGTRIVADNFKVGAELGFALGNADIAVLDHPLNRKHGRAPQLAIWGLSDAAVRRGPLLLVLSPSDLPYRELLQRYHDVCAMLGPLPPPRTLQLDRGSRRFLLFRLPAQRAQGACTAPAMAWIDAPLRHAEVTESFDVSGWAFKDGVGLDRVEVLLDGQVAALAEYGLRNDAGEYWRISTDPDHPRVGFHARVRIPPSAGGRTRHWLGLRLHGKDGSVEDWLEQPLRADAAASGR